MYNQIIPFGSKEQAIVYDTVLADEGPLTFNSATYSVVGNDGTVLVPLSSVEIGSATDSLTVRVQQTIDALTVDLPPGPNILEFLVSVLDKNGRPRIQQQRFILWVDGPRVYSQYPTAADLQVFLWQQNMLSNPAPDDKSLDLDSYIVRAVSKWEEITGWFPFLAGPDDTTRTISFFEQTQNTPGYAYYNSWAYDTFNPLFFGVGVPARELSLRGGLLSLTSVVSNGTTYTPATPNITLQLLPVNAPYRKRPYERLNIGGLSGGVSLLLDVTGRWGFCSVLTGDQFGAILSLAAIEAAPTLAYLLNEGVTSYTEADVTESVSSNPFSLMVSQMNMTVQRAIGAMGQYNRYVIA